MAQTYEQWKKSYEGMTSEQQKQYNDILKTKGADYIGNQYMSQYNSANTPSTPKNNTSTITTPEVSNSTNTPTSKTGTISESKANTSPTPNTSNSGRGLGSDYYNQFKGTWDNMTYEQQQKALQNSSVKQYTQSVGLTSKKPEQNIEGANQYNVQTRQTPTQPTKAENQWDYQAANDTRMQEVVNNLDWYKTNPATAYLFDDYNKYKAFFLDGKGRSKEQAQLVDDYFWGQKEAEKRALYTPDQLATAYLSGQVSDSYLNTLKYTDPEKFSMLQASIQKAQGAQDSQADLDSLLVANGYESGEDAASSNTKQDFIEWAKEYGLLVDEDGNLVDDRREITSSPYYERYIQTLETSNDYSIRLQELYDEKRQVVDNLKEQYPDADLSTIMVLAQDRTSDYDEEIYKLNRSIQQLNGQAGIYQQDFEYRIGAADKTIAQLQKDLGMYYDYSPTGLSELAQAQYAATNVTLDQADTGTYTQKQMALESVLTPIFEQYGSIIQRPMAQVINDVISYAKKNGVTLSEALEKNFMSYLRDKPAYKTIQSQLSYSTPETVKIGDEGYYWDATTRSWRSLTGGGGNYEFGEEIRTGDTIGNDINSIGHILDSDDGLRVGTYYNKDNGHTYNVYANREDGITAAKNLLKRAYYGMTLGDAAQKRIGQGKDISEAKKVIQQKGLGLNDKLSDSNVRKFIEAIGQWEGTLKGKSLDDWAKGGNNNFSSYKGSGGNNGEVTPEDLSDWNSGVDKLFEANVLSGIPIQLRNTNVEKEYYLSIIDELYNMGITDVFEASQMISGFVINNTSTRAKEAQKQVLNVLKATSGKGALPSETLQAIASDINNGNYEGAYNRLETAMGEFAYNTDIPSVQTYTPQGMGGAMTAISDIEKINPLGWTSGNLENYLQGLGLEGVNTTTIAGNLTSLGQALKDMGFGEIEVYGGKTSGGKKIEGLLPTINDNREVFKKKLANIEDIIVRNTNQRRKAYGLPEINKKQLFSGNYNSLYGLDKGLRRPYGSSSSSTQIQGDELF